ncbi:MAG: thioredoxin [Clostridiales bacterium]|nr:thioredoxin [Clostridiales bacterium]
MSDKIKYPNIDSFEAEVLKSDIPVLVDFYADWCGPCQSIAPILNELAEQYDGKLKICKINVDENQKLAISHQVMSIPTMLIFKGGEIKDRIVGAMPKPVLEGKINAVL